MKSYCSANCAVAKDRPDRPGFPGGDTSLSDMVRMCADPTGVGAADAPAMFDLVDEPLSATRSHYRAEPIEFSRRARGAFPKSFLNAFAGSRRGRDRCGTMRRVHLPEALVDSARVEIGRRCWPAWTASPACE